MPETDKQEKNRQEAEFSSKFWELFHALQQQKTLNVFDFRGFQFPSLNMTNKQFDKAVDFTKAVFAGPLVFRICIFRRGVTFQEARFKKEVDFSSIWVKNAQFISMFPKQSAEAELPKPDDYQPTAIFSLAVFDSTIIFNEIEFAGRVFFGFTTFNAKAYFIKVKLYGQSEPAILHQMESFIGAVFNEEVSFNNCFFKAAANFQAATFAKSVTFKVDEKPGCFRAESNFRQLKIGEDAVVTFDKINLAKASFLDTNVESFSFRDVKWHKPSVRWLFGVRRAAMLYDEVLKDQDKYTPDKINYYDQQKAEDYERIAENYRQLVLNYEAKRDYNTAEDFHVGEMETLRKKKVWPINAYALYRLLSNYGTSYWHAFTVLLIMILFFSTTFMFTGFRLSQESGEPTGKVIQYRLSLKPEEWASAQRLMEDYREAVLFSLSIIPFNRERFYEPVGWQTRLCLYIAVFSLTSQLALILLAIRQRFKR